MYISRFLVLLSMLVATATVLAEHEADHRYTIEGSVLDANNQPLANTDVSVSLGNETLKFTKTDDQGFYNMRLHLHDADWGKQLRIKAGADEATIEVEFKRGDTHTPRIHYANFVGGKLVEKSLTGFRMPVWAYVGGAILVFVGTGIVADRVRRKNLREKRREQKQQSKKSKKKKKH